MVVKPAAGLRKRQQINRANKVMFLSIAGVSIIVGFSVVIIIFLAQKIWFGEKVISEKLHTASVLETNLKVAPELKNNVRVLNTNQDLQSTRLKETDSALQSILDALPADANSTAMASSLQTKLLSGVPGVSIDSLKVDPVGGVEVSGDNVDSSSSSDPGSNTIGFSFVVSAPAANQESLRQVLLNIEKSIRPFKVTTVAVESQGSRVVMTVSGVGYYQPSQSIQLKDKVVKP